MLYQLYDLKKGFLHPVFEFLQSQGMVIENTFKEPLIGRNISGLLDILARINADIEKPDYDIMDTVVNGETVSITEEVVMDYPFAQLLHFKKNKKLNQPKVLIVAPMSGHYASLLRDTVRAMLPDTDVYITDWKNARDVPLSEGYFSVEKNTSYLIDFLQKIGPGAHMMAVCQPVVQVAAAAIIMNMHKDKCAPSTITLMGGPLDPRVNKTEVNYLAERYSLDWFKKTMLYKVPGGYPGEGRLVYPGVLQLTAFIMMNPDKHFMKFVKYHTDYIKNDKAAMDKHNDFYDEYLTVMDMDAPWFVETIDQVFQRYVFPKGEMLFKGETVDPSKMTKTALMTVEGENDDISAPGQSYAAHNIFQNISQDMKESHLQPGVGHYGVFSGSKWRQFIAPKVKKFMLKHNKPVIWS